MRESYRIFLNPSEEQTNLFDKKIVSINGIYCGNKNSGDKITLLYSNMYNKDSDDNFGCIHYNVDSLARSVKYSSIYYWDFEYFFKEIICEEVKRKLKK